tara:strand:+ start:6341 stop:7087 length:747 start_codon:yes stop_codon:yes gene_type:complete
MRKLYYYIFHIISILLILVLFYFLKPKISENFEDATVYLFWTGGYDSTYRLCELLLIEKKKVQPIYVTYNLDSEKQDDFWVRKNRQNEINSMNEIINILFIRYPYVKKLLNSTLFIENNIDNLDYDKEFVELNLWPKKRKIHQYSHLGKISYHLKIPLELGLLGIDGGKPFILFINKHIDEKGRLKVSKSHPLYYFKFPLFKRTKKELCDTAKKYNFDDIMRKSWSCWFPKNNEPCKKCPMCRQRFKC